MGSGVFYWPLGERGSYDIDFFWRPLIMEAIVFPADYMRTDWGKGGQSHLETREDRMKVIYRLNLATPCELEKRACKVTVFVSKKLTND